MIGFGGGAPDGDEGYASGESPSRLTSGGLLAVAAALQGAAAVAGGARLPSLGKVAAAAAGFAPVGGPAGFIGGALLGYLLAYLAYYAANRNAGITPSFAGFTHVLSCERQVPVGRDPLGNPAACDVLQAVLDHQLYDPYDAGELTFGFQTQWAHIPALPRYATVDKYAASGGAAVRPAAVDERSYSDEMLGAGYEALRNATTNPWPDAEQSERDGRLKPAPAAGFNPTIPPSVDAEAMPQGRMAPNPNSLRLPYRLVVSRRDEGNPYRIAPYTWTAGPRPGEFPPPVVLTPIRVPAVTVDRDGNQTPGRVKPNVIAPPRVHERKVKAKSAGAAHAAYMKMFGGMTEIGEFVDAIYDALPESIRRNDYFANGRHELGRDGKLWSIYQNYQAINVDTMVKNIVFNNLQDAIIGKASGDITAATGGSPLARTLGLL